VNEVEDREVREALHEFHQYLSDQLAPLLVRDAMSVLLTCSPALMGSAIQSWLRAQLGARRDAAPVSDYLFHAMSKVHAFGQLDLVDRQTLNHFLSDLADEVLSFCPAEDRELLRTNIVGLGESRHDGTEPAVQLLHRQARPSAGPGSASAVSPEIARELRRLELLASRLNQSISSSGQPAPERIDKRRELVTEVLAAAAASSSNSEELRQHLTRLQQMGVPAEMSELFNALSDSLPGWSLSAIHGPGGTPEPFASLASSSALHAMRKIFSLASDSSEASTRFRDLVHAGIRQFNEGVLARSAVIFDLAGHLVKEKAVSPSSIEAVQARSHELLAQERLRKLAESPEKHEELRKVLTFFPRLSPQGLLDDLPAEENRDRRRLLLALLLAHGEAARTACLERLGEALSSGAGADGGFRRDLIHVLRAIPPVDDDTVEREIGLIASISPQDEEELLVEAISYLGERKHEKAVSALISYLRAFEELLVNGLKGSADQRRRVIALLNRTVSTLARMGIAEGTVAAVEHGLKDVPELGDTRARLVALSAQDLSQSPELVSRVLESLRAELPGKLIGRFVKTKEDTILHVITALSGTPSREVRSTFADLAKKFPDKKFGGAARKALASFDVPTPPRAPSASLSGDLELFGLPNLLQSLNGVGANGTLTLFDHDENVMSTIRFVQGRVENCQTGMLRREAAVYQLFEKPSPGTFAFRSETDVGPTSDEGAGFDVTGLIMEGVRRYDELQRASALVPDDAVLQGAGSGPTPVEDEPNEALIESVWERAISGIPASELDRELPVDSYRVRRLLAQWVEQGSLCHGAAHAN
jgi:hypothetical protein